MKTELAVRAYTLLKEAKLSKMETEDIKKVLKIMRILRPIAEKYEADLSEAETKLKGDEHDKMTELAKKWQADEKAISEKEKKEVNAYFEKYQKSLGDYVKGLNDEAVDVKITKLGETIMSKLIVANDFKIKEMMILTDVLEEEKS